jgi:hypothetical protein
MALRLITESWWVIPCGKGYSLHPHFFMDNLLTPTPIVDGKLFWFVGEQPVRWIAPVPSLLT